MVALKLILIRVVYIVSIILVDTHMYMLGHIDKVYQVHVSYICIICIICIYVVKTSHKIAKYRSDVR